MTLLVGGCFLMYIFSNCLINPFKSILDSTYTLVLCKIWLLGFKRIYFIVYIVYIVYK